MKTPRLDLVCAVLFALVCAADVRLAVRNADAFYAFLACVWAMLAIVHFKSWQATR